MGNKQSVERVNSPSASREKSSSREPSSPVPRLKRKTSNENLSGTPNCSAESAEASTPQGKSPTKTAVAPLTVSTPPTSPKKKTLQGPQTVEKKEDERTPSARMLAKAVPVSPPKSDADDNDYVNLENLVSARSPSDTNQAGMGKQLVMGLSGLWSKSMNWWFTSQSKEETNASSPLPQSKASGSQEDVKEDSAKTCLVLIKEPENGRRTVDKKEPQYQTLYGLQDPFEKKNDGSKENPKE